MDEVNKRIDEFLETGLNQALEKGMKKACILVQDDGKVNCPVDTGRLRASITHEVVEEEKNVVGYVGSNVEYAPYVEAKKHFLEDAMNANQQAILNCFGGLV